MVAPFDIASPVSPRRYGLRQFAVHQVALLNRAGVAYVHLCVDIPAHLRGMELSAGQLEALGARLQKFRVEPVDSV